MSHGNANLPSEMQAVYRTNGEAIRAAMRYSKRERTGCYVVTRRTGDIVGYAVTPVGTVAPWETLLCVYDSGERIQ